MEKIPERNLAGQFDAGHQEYSSFIESDPIRNFLHYPSVIRELGDIQNKRLLDIGCGDGLFDRKLAAEYGTKIVGYDISSNLIARAQQQEKELPLGIEYTVSDPIQFQSTEQFDDAVAVMVLPYSPNAQYVRNFFSSAHKNLKAGGRFVCVVFNPEFNGFNEVIANRFFRKADEQKVDFDFLDLNSKEVRFNAQLAQFSKTDYERGAREGGFEQIEWKALIPDDEGIKKFGADFWSKVVETQPYSLIIAERA
ncbi:MAG: class I SAM-dependent methyltransferase [bacterium]|nr:class I SAM-dependent methyltransferase [bacterium]